MKQQVQWKVVQSRKHGSSPTCRWGHSSCVVKDSLYIFGGFANSNYLNDLWCYNLNTLQWQQIITHGDIPEKRSNATVNYDPVNNQLLLFGGGGSNKQRFNTISMLDLESKYWVEILPFENQPAPWQRTYHIAEFKFPYLIVFAGQGVDDLGDLWIYNFIQLTWKQIKIEKDKLQPKARRFHSSCIVNNKIYIFGGCYDKYVCLSDLFSLDLTQLLQTGNSNNLQWQQIKIKPLVTSRWGHTSYHYNGQIYVFGGRASEDLNDLIAIDIITGDIRNIEVQNAPKARRRHSGGFIGSSMILYGGFDGNYYDDLFYINLYRSKHEKQIEIQPKRIIQPLYPNVHVVDKLGKRFYINMELVNLFFQTQNHAKRFVENIKGQYSKQQLKIIFETLYNGYGDLPLFENHFKYISRSLMLQKIKNVNLISQIIGDCTVQFPYFISKQNLVIELQGKSLSKYLKYIKQHWSCTSKIIINKQQCMMINKDRVIERSKYFFNIFKFSTHKKFQPFFNVNYGDLFYFQLIMAYLQTGLFVIPKNPSLDLFTALIKISQYLSLNEILRICQKELSKKLTQQNYGLIQSISQEYKFEYLNQQCNLFMLKDLQYKYKTLVLNSEQMKKLSKDALQLYGEIVFDLAHISQKKQETKSPEAKYSQMNKENQPSNAMKPNMYSKTSLFHN